MPNVCVFGDSIAWGSWDPVGGGWAGRLREAGCTRQTDHCNPRTGDYTAVLNCSVNGNKIADLLARFDGEASARDAAAIVLAIGLNDVPHDGYSGTTPEAFELAYGDLIARAKNYANDIVAVTPINVDESRSEHDYRNTDIAILVEVIARCAADADLPVVNVFGLMTPDDLHPDGLHPGAQGHEKLFRAIGPVLFGLPSLND